MKQIEKTNDTLLYTRKIRSDHSSIPRDWKSEMPVFCFRRHAPGGKQQGGFSGSENVEGGRQILYGCRNFPSKTQYYFRYGIPAPPLPFPAAKSSESAYPPESCR